jgi:hypothetical protein
MAKQLNKDKWKIARQLYRKSKKDNLNLEEWLKYDLKILKMVCMIKNKETKWKMKK